MANLVSRKQFIIGAAATAATAFIHRPARAAQYRFKLGHDIPPGHPITDHLAAAAAKVKDETKGQVEIGTFPNNQLGNDNHMLAQLRSGAMQMMAVGDNILAEIVPAAAVDGIGFAFKDADTAFAALDGGVGVLVRAEIEKVGLHPMSKIWDEGFREITTSTKPINTPADLQGFKMRVPPSPISMSLFKSLGAAPLTLNSSEMYTGLQTHLADGQENPLSNILANKVYEVQKYCSMTGHMWVGYWVLVNGAAWKSLPPNLRDIVENTFNAEVPKQRIEVEALNASLVKTMEEKGIIFNHPDIAPFRQALVASGYYKQWQENLGPQLWQALQKYSGPLG